MARLCHFYQGKVSRCGVYSIERKPSDFFLSKWDVSPLFMYSICWGWEPTPQLAAHNVTTVPGDLKGRAYRATQLALSSSHVISRLTVSFSTSSSKKAAVGSLIRMEPWDDR